MGEEFMRATRLREGPLPEEEGDGDLRGVSRDLGTRDLGHGFRDVKVHKCPRCHDRSVKAAESGVKPGGSDKCAPCAGTGRVFGWTAAVVRAQIKIEKRKAEEKEERYG